MRKLRIAAILAVSVIMLTSAVSCSTRKKIDSSSSKVDHSNAIEISEVTPKEEVGSVKHEAKLYEPVTVDDTVFTINKIIDFDHVTSDGRYIYIDYTIENKSNEKYPTDAINNFYINVDGEEDVFDIRSDVFAKRYVNGYSSSFVIEPNTKITNYVGFVIPENAQSIEVGYYVTGSDRDKRNIVLCEVTPDDFEEPNDGMFKEDAE